MTFKPGDVVKIIANETFPRHNIALGTEVTILREHEERGTWYIKPPGDGSYENWAIEGDLEPCFDEAELDAEARRLLGVDPPTYCHACGQALP